MLQFNLKNKQENSCIAIILARGGSKGIKNKNLKKINKKPLIYWSIKQCLNSKKIKQTWLSSDSLRILQYAKKNGINIIVRPKKYAFSNSSSESAWLHAVKFLEKKKIFFDSILGIQPTSPIRGRKDFDNAINFFYQKKLDSLFSSTAIRDFFYWEKNLKKFTPNYNYKIRKPRQKIKKKFLENGSFYIFNKNNFKIKKNRLFGKIGTYVQENYKGFQLDEIHDYYILESIMKNKKIKDIFNA
jgi:N-acylneuraminate cytidylyltransferase